MRTWMLLLTLILALLIQTTMVMDISPWGLIPDLILLIVLSYGLLKGPFFGMSLGLVGGFAIDFIGGGIIGINALSKMIIGLLCGAMEKTIFKDNLLVPALAAAIVTILQDLIIYLVLVSFGNQQPFVYHMIRYTLPLMAYHMILAPVIYRMIFRGERYVMLRKSL